MFWFGLIVGAVLMGILANRRPQWFAKVVKAANAVDDKVNAGLAQLKSK
jgi:hypothetical protein